MFTWNTFSLYKSNHITCTSCTLLIYRSDQKSNLDCTLQNTPLAEICIFDYNKYINYPKTWYINYNKTLIFLFYHRLMHPKEADRMADSVDTDQAALQKQSSGSTLLAQSGPTHYCMGHVMRKCVLCHMQTTKVQISLRIRAVWSAPLLFAA